jgi:DNA-binding transcriptional MerR regulator
MSDTSDYVTLEQVEELLEEQRAEFEARLETKDERIAELEERIDDLESSHDLTQSTVWEHEDVVTSDYDCSHPHLQGKSVVDRVDDIEERLEASTPRVTVARTPCTIRLERTTRQSSVYRSSVRTPSTNMSIRATDAR